MRRTYPLSDRRLQRSLAVSALMLTLIAAKAFGTCHATGPAASGNGSGSDWNNVIKLPTAPVRGDIYYLMDGSYGSYGPTTATSSTTRITIKKAQTYDYGRASDGCTNDISAGWNSATMGSSQAVFSGVGGVFSTSGGQGYYTVDGNGKTATAGCGVSPAVNAAASDCGIKMMASGTSASTYGVLWINGTYDNGATRATGWTVRYVEIVGAGDAEINVTNGNEHTLYCRNGCNNLLFEHNYLHDCGTDCIDTPWGDTDVFNLNHFQHNPIPTSANHGQFWLGDGAGNGGINNYTWSNNIIEDMGGTAIWAVLNGGQQSNWNIFNNVLVHSASYAGHTDDGIFSVINSGSSGSNVNIYDNTWIHWHVNYSGAFSFVCETKCSGLNFQNNLLYNIIDNQDGTRPIGDCGAWSGCTTNHNSYLNVPGAIGMAGTADVQVTSGSASPFVNWSAYNFKLVGESNNVNNGLSLVAPYNVDASGDPRPGSDGVWDRGAFEYATSQAPAPPTGLSGTIQ